MGGIMSNLRTRIGMGCATVGGLALTATGVYVSGDNYDINDTASNDAQFNSGVKIAAMGTMLVLGCMAKILCNRNRIAPVVRVPEPRIQIERRR